MPDRPDVLSAKVEMLAKIVSDGQKAKRSTGNSVADARKAEQDALTEVLEAGGSVADVKAVDLPTDRL